MDGHKGLQSPAYTGEREPGGPRQAGQAVAMLGVQAQTQEDESYRENKVNKTNTSKPKFVYITCRKNVTKQRNKQKSYSNFLGFSSWPDTLTEDTVS